MTHSGLTHFVLIHALIAGLISLGVPSRSMAATVDSAPRAASWSSAVEFVTGATPAPSEQLAPLGPEGSGRLVPIVSIEVPEPWMAPATETLLNSLDPALSGSLRVEVVMSAVAVAVLDKGGAPIGYGVGLQSDVTVSLSVDEPSTHFTSAFQLASHAASAMDAVAGAMDLSQAIAVAPTPADDHGSIYYSACVAACLKSAHDRAWRTFLWCLDIAMVAEGVIASGCVLGCLLAGPGWLVCVKACLATLAASLQLPIAMFVGSCFASYVARMTLAIGVCAWRCW